MTGHLSALKGSIACWQSSSILALLWTNPLSNTLDASDLKAVRHSLQIPKRKQRQRRRQRRQLPEHPRLRREQRKPRKHDGPNENRKKKTKNETDKRAFKIRTWKTPNSRKRRKDDATKTQKRVCQNRSRSRLGKVGHHRTKRTRFQCDRVSLYRV